LKVVGGKYQLVENSDGSSNVFCLNLNVCRAANNDRSKLK